MGRSLRPNRGVASNKAAIRAATSSAEPVDVELAPLSALPIKLVESLGGGAGVRRPTAPAERRVVVAASTPPTTDHVDGRACEKRANVIVLATAPVGCRVRKTLIPATPPGAEPAVNLDRTLSFGVAAEDAADLAVDAVAAVGAAAPLRLGVVAELGVAAEGWAALGAAFATVAPASWTTPVAVDVVGAAGATGVDGALGVVGTLATGADGVLGAAGAAGAVGTAGTAGAAGVDTSGGVGTAAGGVGGDGNGSPASAAPVCQAL